VTHHEAQHVAALLGSALGQAELRDNVEITTNRNGVRLRLYGESDAALAGYVLRVVADFISDNGFIDTAEGEIVTGLVLGTSVVAHALRLESAGWVA
jgi:hypothetical protein